MSLVKLLVEDVDEALEFYTTRLGFEVAEDESMGVTDGCSCVCPTAGEFCIDVEAAKTDEQRALIGRQAADLPLVSIEADDCGREYEAMKARGVTFEGKQRPVGTALASC